MRREISSRPLVTAAIGLILGTASLAQPLLAPVVLLFVLWIRDLRASLFVASAFVVGLLIGRPPVQPLLERVWVEGEAVVESVPRMHPDSSTCEIRIGEMKLLASLPRESGVTLGDAVFVRGVAKPFREGSERNKLLKGIAGRITPQSMEVVREGPWIYGVGQAWRSSFVAFCERTLPARAASAAEAVCFNVDTALDPDDMDSLRRSGTVHIVSASGLHVAVFAGFLALALAALPVPRRVQIVLLLLVLVAYAAATGLRPPVVRSVIMAGAVLVAYLWRREADLFSALGLAAVFQLLWRPTDVHDIGFQLSFLIVGALVMFARQAEPGEKSFREALADRMRMHGRQGLVATAAGAPFIAYTFGLFSLTSIPANLLIVLMLPFLVTVALVAHALSFVVPSLATGLMSGFVGPMTGWIYSVTGLFGGEWSALNVPPFSALWLVPAYGLALVVWRPNVRAA